MWPRHDLTKEYLQATSSAISKQLLGGPCTAQAGRKSFCIEQQKGSPEATDVSRVP